MNKKIAIIGIGHMGKAFYEGLILSGNSKENILTSDKTDDNEAIAEQAEIIVVAVKPNDVGQVIEEIKNVITDKLIISVAVGVTIASIQKYAGNDKQKIIRIMPNIPVAYGKGVIGFYANEHVSEEEKDEVRSLLSGLGKIISCNQEKDLDAMTILSGSGPAVVAYCLSLFEKAGESFGFEKEAAQKIAYQTFLGTLEVLKETNQTAQQLQDAVATKGGTTEQIINSLNNEQISSKFQESFEAGYARIKKIREVLRQAQD